MASSVVGLEITEEGIRAAEVTTGKTPTLVAAGMVPLPPDAARDSEILDPDAVVLGLNQLWAQFRFSTRRAVLGIANRRVLVREYVSPRLDLATIKATLPYAVQELLPVPPDQAVLDFLPTRETADEISGLLVATVAENVERLIDTVKLAKIHATEVDFIPFGLSRAINRFIAPQPQPVAIMSAGQHTTSVVVVQSGLPSFVRIVPIDLAPDPVPAPAPEEVGELDPVGPARRAVSLTPPPVSHSDVFDDLATRLDATLTYHAAREGEHRVSTVFLTGAMASLTLSNELTNRLNVDIRPITVSDVVTLSKAMHSRGTPPPDLFNAVGTAMTEVRP